MFLLSLPYKLKFLGQKSCSTSWTPLDVSSEPIANFSNETEIFGILRKTLSTLERHQFTS